MTLSIGTGPLAGSPAGEFNFDFALRSPETPGATSGRRYIDAPKHRIWFADYAPRLRAVLGGSAVFDTTRAKLLYETGILPVPYVPLEDFDHARMTRTERSTHCPFKGDASYWSVGDAESVVWAYEDPKPEAAWLNGYAAVYWDRMDGWFIEEERVFAHLRDPYHRVDVHESSRPVEVRVDGEVIARTARPKLLFETGLATRVYVPRADVAAGVLSQAEKRTQCPYKGEATYWSLPGIADAAWSYEAPLPEAVKVQGHVSFDADGVEVELGPPRASVPPAPPTAR